MATVRTRTYFNGKFITGYKPTQTDYKDLFLTVPMKKETGDRAKVTTGSSNLETEVGLVVLATNTQATTNAAQLTDRSLVVQPHQLPTLVEQNETITSTLSSYSGEPAIKAEVDNTTTRNNYVVGLKTDFVTWLVSVFDGIQTTFDSISSSLSTLASKVLPIGGSTGQILVKNSSTNYDAGWSNFGYKATSASTVTIGTGSKSFTIGTGYFFDPNIPTRVRAYSAASGAAYFMEGQVTNYTGGVLTLLVDLVGNSGTPLNSWILNISDLNTLGDLYTATSSDSKVIGTGSFSFNIGTGYAYNAYGNLFVRIYSISSPTNYYEAIVTGYSGGLLTVSVVKLSGSGTYSDWKIILTGYNAGTWVDASSLLQTGYTSTGGLDDNSNSLCSYRKDYFGFVELRGYISAASPAGNLLLTLPTGFRPPHPRSFPVAGYGATSGGIFVVIIQANGQVQIVDTAGANLSGTKNFYLDTIRFNISD